LKDGLRKEAEDLGNDKTEAHEQHEPDYSYAHPIFYKGMNLESYLSDKVLNDFHALNEVKHRLEVGEVVIIPNAFDEEFAEAMYQELHDNINYTVEEGYFNDSSYHLHTTAGDLARNTAFLNQTQQIFSSLDTRFFMTELSHIDCGGETHVEPTLFAPGDYATPQTGTEAVTQHTIAFMWILSKNWLPEWGGALYWCQEQPAFSYVHASFNTLVLFEVTTESKHMTTMVSEHATEKRLSYNGFWSSNWHPEPQEDLEHFLELNGDKMTRHQYETIQQILKDSELEKERHDEVQELVDELHEERYPQSRYIFEVNVPPTSPESWPTASVPN
jgi:hypothetical protein